MQNPPPPAKGPSRLRTWLEKNAVGIASVLVAIIGLFVAEQTTNIVSHTWNIAGSKDDVTTDEVASPSADAQSVTDGRVGVLPVDRGLVSWWAADDGVETNDQGEVVRWADLVSSNDLMPATGKPTLLTEATNGRAAIRFFDGELERSEDGSGPSLVDIDPTGLPSGNAQRTIVVVAQLPQEWDFFYSAPKMGMWWGDSSVDARWGGLGFSMTGCTGESTFSWLAAGGFTCGRYAEFGYTPGTRVGEGYGVTIATYSSGTLRVYVNGVEETIVPDIVFETASQPLTVGAVDEVGHLGRVTSSGDFDVAMTAVYDQALSPDEVELLSSHLTTEYLGK